MRKLLIKYISWASCVAFAFYMIHINFLATNQRETLPNFTRYKNIVKREIAFNNYITPMITKQNQDFLKLRMKILRLKEKFNSTGRLSFDDLYFLNTIYRKINHFTPYEQSSWQLMISNQKNIPVSAMLKKARSIQSHVNKIALEKMSRNNNPMAIKDLPKFCAQSSIILNKNMPWMLNPNCYYSARISAQMQYTQKTYALMNYQNLQLAFSHYIWIHNTQAIKPIQREIN